MRRRPPITSECHEVKQAEKWRRDILKELTKSISEIQNASLGEHRIRDLNDHINKLLKEKYAWGCRIQELGGPNYNGRDAKSFDADGRELPNGGGYRYFGAARDLPGVRELFQAEAPEVPRRTRADIYKNITPDYYGYRDEDDGVLLSKEATKQRKLVEIEEEKFQQRKRQRQEQIANTGKDYENTYDEEESDESGEEDFGELGFGDAEEQASALNSASMKAHVAVPSQDEIKNAILSYRKQQLLQQFE